MFKKFGDLDNFDVFVSKTFNGTIIPRFKLGSYGYDISNLDFDDYKCYNDRDVFEYNHQKVDIIDNKILVKDKHLQFQDIEIDSWFQPVNWLLGFGQAVKIDKERAHVFTPVFSHNTYVDKDTKVELIDKPTIEVCGGKFNLFFPVKCDTIK